ncbi:hypothetical protein AB3480_08810 [Rhizobium mongolense]
MRAHADHNAAINILRRNTASMIVEEGQPLSVEAIPIGGASRPLGNPPLASGQAWLLGPRDCEHRLRRRARPISFFAIGSAASPASEARPRLPPRRASGQLQA